MARKFLAGILLLIMVLITPTISRAAAIYGFVVDRTTNMPISNSYVRLHRYDEASGYLLFVDSTSTGRDGFFVFKFPEPRPEPKKSILPTPVPPVPTGGVYLLEADRQADYLLTRQEVIFDGVNDARVSMLLTQPPASIQAGEMVWDENATTLRWSLMMRNYTSRRQAVEVYGLVGSPAITGNWINFETEHQGRILEPFCHAEVTLEVNIPQEIPAGFSVCISAYITKPKDNFTMYGQMSQCMVKPFRWRVPPSIITEPVPTSTR